MRMRRKLNRFAGMIGLIAATAVPQPGSAAKLSATSVPLHGGTVKLGAAAMTRSSATAWLLVSVFSGAAFAAPFQNGSFEEGGIGPCNTYDVPAGSTLITGWTVTQ